MQRTDRHSTGAQRPYSSNNPFRNVSHDSSINQYESDADFQNWVSQNTKPTPYSSGRRNDSTSSFTDSIEETSEEEYANNDDYFIDVNPSRMNNDSPRSPDIVDRFRYVQSTAAATIKLLTDHCTSILPYLTSLPATGSFPVLLQVLS
ncbi:unnamed protein product [Kluyveromyces dobzhanskii CBS 2104]|uniref:WGS project CCBQ000000000 data, contig 00058 n=1 Tax=Kluyveromyces dobzhanskii CBS 2104 TaxID=1427455 RepID=A0A0A8LDM0_9SACH|nr:unnamed protein product [Kluyveromyces dobzhanskii CBS 2104]